MTLGAGGRVGLKWVPGRSRREFKIADVVSEPEPEPGADWHHDHFFIGGSKGRHTKASNETAPAMPLNCSYMAAV
jgi:hypothetical protein